MSNSSQGKCLEILDIIKSDRREFTFTELIKQGFDLRNKDENELLSRLRDMTSIDINEEKQTIKYKPKINAPNKDSLIKYIKAQKFKGVCHQMLVDAYLEVHDDLLDIQKNPSKYGLIVLRSEKDKDLYYYSDPKEELFPDLPQADQELIGEWKNINVQMQNDDCIRTVNNSKLIPYHHLKTKEKKGKKD